MSWDINNADEFEKLVKSLEIRCWKNVINESDWINKPKSDNYTGIYLHGGHKPITYKQEYLAFASFIKYSQFKYPILWFYGGPNDDNVQKLLKKFDNIQLIPISPIIGSNALNDFYLYQLPKLIPEQHEKLLYFQDDGFLIKSGWEQFIEEHDFDYVGPPWYNYINYPLFVYNFYVNEMKLNKKDFKFQEIGNGGFCYRKRSKMISVSNAIPKPDKLLELGNKMRENPQFRFDMGITEDWISCHVGFNSGIFKSMPVNIARQFAQELSIEWIGDKIKSIDDIQSFGFHCNYINK